MRPGENGDGGQGLRLIIIIYSLRASITLFFVYFFIEV